MNRVPEERLHAELNMIPVPTDELELARERGRLRAKRHHASSVSKRWAYRLSIVMAIIIMFIASIRISPVFASTVAKIPGFASLVEMITYDKGLEDIVENEYYEPLNISVTENDLTFTLEGIIADQTGMIIFYNLKAPYDISSIGQRGDVRIKQGGQDLEAGYGMGGSTLEETMIVHSKVELNAPNGIDYSDPQFIFEIQFQDMAETKFIVPFTLMEPIAASKRYELNDVVTIDGQALTVEYVVISPLRAEVAISVDEANDMQLLQFDDLRLVDETGEEWGNIRNGISGTGNIRKGKASYYIQSNYFRKPEQLTLQIGGVQALPKGEDYIEVDFEQKEIIHQPKSMSLEVIFVNEHGLRINYPDDRSDHMGQVLESAGIDANGELIYMRSSTSSRIEVSIVSQSIYFDTTVVANPVKFNIWSYPNYLSGTAEVKLPLQ